MTVNKPILRPRPRSVGATAPATPLAYQPVSLPAPPPDEVLLVPVLARISLVSVESAASTTAPRLIWKPKVDWSAMTGWRPSPRLIAGSLVGLVILLLVIIYRGRDRNGTTVTDEPSQNIAHGDHEPHAADSIKLAGKEHGNALKSYTQSNAAARPTEIKKPGGLDTRTELQVKAPDPKMQGIYYPKTPYDLPIGIVPDFAPSASGLVRDTSAAPAMSAGIRTATREVRPSPANDMRSANPPVATFDGVITQPPANNHERNRPGLY